LENFRTKYSTVTKFSWWLTLKNVRTETMGLDMTFIDGLERCLALSKAA